MARVPPNAAGAEDVADLVTAVKPVRGAYFCSFFSSFGFTRW